MLKQQTFLTAHTGTMRRFCHHIWGFIACILLLIQDVTGCGGCNPGDGTTSNFCTRTVRYQTSCGWWRSCRTAYRSEINRTCCRGYKISNGCCVRDCGGCTDNTALSQSACPVDVTRRISQIAYTQCSPRVPSPPIPCALKADPDECMCSRITYRQITERKYTQSCPGYTLIGQDCKKNCGGCGSRSPDIQDACQTQVTRRITARETYYCPIELCDDPCPRGQPCMRRPCPEHPYRKKRSICTRVTYRYVRNTVYSCCTGFRRQGTQCICE